MEHGARGPREGRIDLEARLVEALDARTRGGDPGLADWLRDHPSCADLVRERLARLATLGLLDVGRDDGVPPPVESIAGFRLVERLGEGGMGLVWIAEEVALGRRVALKMVRPEQLWFDGARERFRREVEAVARLAHPAIVPVYAAGEEGGVPWFTMELVDGASLLDVLRMLRGRDPASLRGADLAAAIDASRPRRAGADGAEPARGPLFEGTWTEAALQIGRQIAEALEHAHARGIVHRDVKPSNVALTRTGRAMLLDFGLARTAHATRLTRSDAQPGSLPYMSPEQLAGADDVDARTDVYSLGATLYELLTLRPAFGGANATEVATRIAAGDVARPRALVPRLARDVETVTLKALAPAREARYPSAGDLARDLGNLLAHRPVEARRAGFGLRLLRWAQRHPRLSASAAAVVPLVLVGAALVAGLERARSAEILRLADVTRLTDLSTEADRLWPATPELVPAYERWLARADELRARLAVHRATFAELSARRAAGGAAADSAGDEVRWQHDTLAGLIAGIEALEQGQRPLAPGVRERLAFARTIGERSLTSPQARAAWDSARRSIADAAECPAYRGLDLAPQLGLVPLGRDPTSGLHEFAHLATGAPATRGADGRLVLAPETGVVLVLLPGGRFQMGSVSDPEHEDHDPQATTREQPAHAIDLEPFFMARHDLTEAQWQRLAGREAKKPLHPVVEVDWFQATRELGRVGLLLPTEAQWEYAARAGTRTPWWTGAEKESLIGAANLLDQSVVRARGGKAGGPYDEWLDDGFDMTSPVDALRPNAFGLHDMCGNVWQWCRDQFADYTNPVRPGDGERLDATTENRVYRGGCCASMAIGSRSAFRTAARPDSAIWVLGARASRAIDPPRVR
ncbi:MAG: SUMF1/EgtB/PvdO family nonheme iron enzyme [Planctomycetes bacterium]|nr:SUMF1/EgtB/PvdO family nonheme iron enzyme [Planctomycetota bacterium]